MQTFVDAGELDVVDADAGRGERGLRPAFAAAADPVPPAKVAVGQAALTITASSPAGPPPMTSMR